MFTVSKILYKLKKRHQNGKQAGPLDIQKNNTNVRPFLNLKDKLTQIWINQYTLVLCLLAVKVFLFHSSLKASVKSLENNMISTCVYINKYGSTLGSLPHYTSKSANKMIATGIQKTHDSVVEGLKLMITGVEEVLYFYIEVMLGTYTCLLTAAVESSVEIATNTTESLIKFVNGSLAEVTDTLESGLTDLSSVVNKVETAGEDLINLFKSSNSDQISFNKVNLTVQSLKKLTIPSSINDKLKNLSGKVPSFDEVQNKTKELINIPFEFAKNKLVNNTSNFSANPDELFVPAIKEVNICPSDPKITEMFQKIEIDAEKALKIILTLVIVAAFCIFIPLTIQAYIRWRKMTNMVQEVYQMRSATSFNDIYDAVDRNYNSWPSTVSNCISSIFRIKNNKNIFKLRWYINYLMTSSAMNLLLLGIAGLLMVLFQYIILRVVISGFNKAKDIFESEKFDVEKFIYSSVNDWTNHTNNYLSQKETNLNDNVFGPIVNATYTLNATISTFYEDLNEALTVVFNGTLFKDPITSVVYCIIGRKIETIEKGLTWIHDNAAISFPRVNESMLYYSIYDTTNGTSLQDKENADNNTSTFSNAESFVSDSVKDIVVMYKKSLLLELYVSLALLGIFLFQILIACCVFKFNNNDNQNYKNDNEDFLQKSLYFNEVNRSNEINRSNETIVEDNNDMDPFSNKYAVEAKQ